MQNAHVQPLAGSFFNRHEIIPTLRRDSLGLSADSFRFYFTGCLTLLFAFPSLYLFTIGLTLYLALEDGSPGFPRCRCTAVLRILLEVASILHTRLSLSLVSHSRLFYYVATLTLKSYNPTPCLRTDWFGLFRFRSPLLTESL